VGLRERITAAAGLGGAGLAAKRILVHFGHKYEPFWLLNDEYYPVFIVH